MSNPTQDILAKARFNSDGLIPAVVQDARTREVLTVAYMNEEALRLTIEKGETHFYSRSRKALWHKGTTSGNFQKVQRVALDCDSDTILVEVEPLGPYCDAQGNTAGRKLHNKALQRRHRQDREEAGGRGRRNRYRGEKRFQPANCRGNGGPPLSPSGHSR